MRSATGMISATSAMHKHLAKRFESPAWALLREVANATGFRAKRSADAIAISLYPSRGLAIHGIEVKVHRSDWLRELKAPEKSAPVQRFCNHWWIAAPSTDVVQLDELPPTWGLLVVQGRRGLVAKVPAPELKPEPLSIDFVASLGRRMNECVDAAKSLAREELVSDEDYQRGYQAGKADAAPTLARTERMLEDTQSAIDQFEKVSGVKLSPWNTGDVGNAVRTIEEQRVLRHNIMTPHVDALERALKSARKHHKALEPFRAKERE